MLYRMTMALIVLTLTALIGGCGGPEGSDFVGHWVGGTEKRPATLDIRYEEGIYHIDESVVYFPEMGPENNQYEAKALSNQVLQVNLGVASLTLRLENAQVVFDDKRYTKVTK